jgi:hypothetical protein
LILGGRGRGEIVTKVIVLSHLSSVIVTTEHTFPG